MPNLNLRLDEETYWKFQEVKAKLKARTNEEALLKLINLATGKGKEHEEEV